MYVRIIGVVGLVGALTACSAAPAAPDGSGAPVPVAGALEVTSPVPTALSAPLPMTDPPAQLEETRAAARTLPASPPLTVTDTVVCGQDGVWCSAPTAPGPAPGRMVGANYFDTNEVIQAPSEVRVGEPFTVTVLTEVHGCLHPGDPVADTEVVMAGNVATIFAYDYWQPPDDPAERNPVSGTEGLCPAERSYTPHTATTQFMEPGEGIVRAMEQEQRVWVR